MKTFQQFLQDAAQIVAAYRAQAPEGFDPVAFNFGGSESRTNSNFYRRGTTSSQKDYQLPGDLSALISRAFKSTAPDENSGTQELGFLTGLLTRDSSSIPGQTVLEAIQAIDPTTFSGSDALATIMARNPYSTDYEDATRQLYERQFDKARAAAISGPSNVRGAQDRMGLELADLDTQMGMERFREIRGQQDREAGTVAQATQIFNAIESMRRGSQMQAQGQQVQSEHSQAQEGLSASNALQGRNAANSANLTLAAETLGKPKQTSAENIRGFGNQSGSSFSWGAGTNMTPNVCCFIFLEALNGELPDYVREGRDKFQTPARRRGYRWMAAWLVPLMQQFKLWRWVVNWTMVKPFLVVGKGYKTKKGIGGYVLLPIALFWFGLWSLIGTLKKEEVCQAFGTI
jgi:hypothetical protein